MSADDGSGKHRDRPFRPAAKASALQRAIPVSAELPHYRAHRAHRAHRAGRDGLAALTVAALAIPSAMAYAELAGVTAVAGLYALLVPTLAYALLGSSRQLIVGPEGSISALAGASVLGLAVAGGTEAGELAATLALLVAACFLLAPAARLGWLADYLSRPVLIGYIHGVAVVLILGQLEKLAGLDVEALDPGAIAGSAGLDLSGEGVAVVGAIPSGLPSPQVPSPPLDDVLTLLPAAVGIFLVCFADEVLTARSFAGRHDQHVRADQELLAMGGAQAAAGLTQGLPIGASGSRTAVNDSMGAQSQLAGLAAAVVVALVLLFLTGPIADLPKAVLGAIIVSAAIGLIEPAAWRALAETDKVELSIAAVTAGGVVVVGVLEAIAFAAGLSIVDVVRRSARPQ